MNHLKLLQLLNDNRRAFTPIQSRISAKDAEGEVGIYLYDPIVGNRVTAEWWGGICPQDFVPALRAIEADRIRLYTNCPGGDVFAAEAMCQALREHPAHVTMQIEGYAASAATSIGCACDEVVATKGSKYMIHQTWTLAMGNADDLMSVVDLLRKCDETMYGEYIAKTGMDREQIEAWCKAETWFTAAQAQEHGFIDSLVEVGKASANAQGRSWNLSAYSNAPNADPAPDPPESAAPPAIAYATTEHRDRQQQRLRMLARVAHQ